MATTVISTYLGNPGLGAAIFAQLWDPAAGVLLIARGNGGIREDKAANYTKVWTGVTDLDRYVAYWDENDGLFFSDVIVPRDVTNVTVDGGGGGGLPLPVVGDGNADVLGKTFLIKRGDTLPYLRRQLVDTNGNAVPIDPADTVMFTMRVGSDSLMTGSPLVHRAANIVDAATGIVEYRWLAADTALATHGPGLANIPNAGEFEWTRLADGKVETFPQADYIAITITRDLDPGLNP